MSDEAQDTEAKPIWQSRTIIGAAVTIFALVAGFKNFKVDVANLTDILVQVAGLIGAALAIYGRIKATKPITFTAGTTPGGAFNPSAPVKKAEPVNAGGTPTLPKNSGRADLDALLLIGVAFLILGMAIYALPPRPPLVEQPVPEVVSGKPMAQWMQVVPVVDSRPFIARLIASLRATPSTALITTEEGRTSLRIVQVELTGGAEF